MVFRTVRHFTAHDGTHYNCGREISPEEFNLVHENDVPNFIAIPDGPRLVSTEEALPEAKKKDEPRKSSNFDYSYDHNNSMMGLYSQML